MSGNKEEQLSALTPLPTPPEQLDAMRQLIEDAENDVARLPEPLFVNHLLPVLVDRSGNTDVSIWLDIAGHAFRPIDVFDPATGHVLFRVPALLRRPATRVARDSRESFSSIGMNTEIQRGRHEALGETYLRTKLSQQQVDGTIDYESVRQWNAILTRYGHEPVVLLSDGPSATSTSETASAAPALSDQQDDF